MHTEGTTGSVSQFWPLKAPLDIPSIYVQSLEH